MPLVNVLVNGRAYTVACDAGEENHVRELGQHLDKRVRELCGAVGQVGDTRLLLMAGLVIADELAEALARIEEQDREIAALRSAMPTAMRRLPALRSRIGKSPHCGRQCRQLRKD